jgi:murein DD-endopeptidase MepM/ murein hydrolase activator NlpD
LVHRPTDTVERTVSGIIKKNSNLTATLNNLLGNKAVGGELAENIAQVYAWTIDFFKLYPDDKFKIVYEEKSVEGKPYGIGQVKAVYFWHVDTVYYAFRFQQGDEISYFNEKGKGMKRPFLKAPLKFSSITSGFSLKRFHPVQKIFKAHLGTDYAAPTGTPIMAVGDGTVEAAGFAQYNGNYVKIKHNATYQTAYLHMSKIAEGMRNGTHVKQGDIIGYVGSTGLATGPHVCFRFWKNGQQIDHRNEKFQSSEPIKDENKEAYMKVMNGYKKILDSLNFIEPVKKPTKAKTGQAK